MYSFEPTAIGLAVALPWSHRGSRAIRRTTDPVWLAVGVEASRGRVVLCCGKVVLDADQPPLLGRDTAVRSLAPFGLGGACTLQVAPAHTTFAGHRGGTIALLFVLPADPLLAGVHSLQEVFVVDPMSATPSPFAVRNAARFVAGS